MLVNPINSNSATVAIEQAENKLNQQVSQWLIDNPTNKSNLETFLAAFRGMSNDIGRQIEAHIAWLEVNYYLLILLMVVIGFIAILYLVFKHKYVIALFKSFILKLGLILSFIIPWGRTGKDKSLSFIQTIKCLFTLNIKDIIFNYCDKAEICHQQILLIEQTIFANVPKRFHLPTLKEMSAGSALIITMLVITVIAAMGFSVSRLTISQMRQTTQLEDSIVAFYVDESGIETGLLMWKFNHNVEVPNDNTAGGPTIEGGMDQTIKNSWRVTINNMDTNFPTDFTIPPIDRTSSIFDLRIWYKNPIIDGKSKEVVCSNDALEDSTSECSRVVNDNEGKPFDQQQPIIETKGKPALGKDNAIQYDVSELDEIKLEWEFKKKHPSYDEQQQMILEFVPIDENNEVITCDCDSYPDKRYKCGCKDVLLYDLKDDNISIPLDRLAETKAKTICLHVFGDSLEEYSITTDTSGEKMTSRFTTIDSTGYYGNSKRRLQIRIDRNSGTILGQYDMVIYQGKETPEP